MPSMLLILPQDSTYHYRGAFRRSYTYAPLTLTTLAALVPTDAGFAISIVDEGVQHPVVTGIYDIVGITAATSAAPRAYELCKFWRAKGAHVVLGGAHPTLLPEEAKLHADTVVIGAAEKCWPAFIKDFLAGHPGNVYKESCTYEELPTQPIARRDLLPRNTYLSATTIIARPGCSNCCEFCSIPHLGLFTLGARPIADVVNELQQLHHKNILFLDPNLTIDKHYAKQLFAAIKPLRLTWAGLASIDVVHDLPLLQLLAESGCTGLLIGFESLCEANLASARKYFARVAEYAHAIRLLHEHRITILGCFVFGFDHDTLSHLDEVPALVKELGVDLPRYSILTPFPGTPLFKRLNQKKRILTTDWSLYDTEHVVFQPAHMTPAELQQALYAAWEKSYSILNIINRTAHLAKNRLLGLVANYGLRCYSKRLIAIGKRMHGTSDTNQF